MPKGLFSGLVWGTLIGGGLLATVSILSPVKNTPADIPTSRPNQNTDQPAIVPPQANTPQNQNTAPAVSETAETETQDDPAQPEETPERVVQEQPETTIETTPPEAVSEVATPEVPETPSENSEVAQALEPEAGSSEEITESSAAELPDVPVEEEPPIVVEAPAPEPTPEPEPAPRVAEPTEVPEITEDVAETEIEAAPENQDSATAMTEELPVQDNTADTDRTDTAETTPSEEPEATVETPQVVEQSPSEDVTPVAPIVSPQEQEVVENTQEPVAPTPTLPQVTEPPVQDSSEEVETQSIENNDAVETAKAPQVETQAPTGIGQPVGRFGQPVGNFANRNSDVRINRLPTVITDPETGLPVEESAEQDAAPSTQPQTQNQTGNSALEKFAEPFSNDTAKPIYSVVLIDVGERDGGLASSALTTFPFPVTFAVPADAPDAQSRARTYRDAGFEVIMLASGIPQSAVPSDVETAFGVYQSAMPEVVAVMDNPDGGFQNNRRQATQVVAILNDTGQGLLTFERGLNAARQIAQREGVPIATIFRQLDEDGDDAETIRRMLDRAAFRASQEGNVVVIGRTRQEMVSTLFSWALEGRAEEVAMAPISAAFEAQR